MCCRLQAHSCWPTWPQKASGARCSGETQCIQGTPFAHWAGACSSAASCCYAVASIAKGMAAVLWCSGVCVLPTSVSDFLSQQAGGLTVRNSFTFPLSTTACLKVCPCTCLLTLQCVAQQVRGVQPPVHPASLLPHPARPCNGERERRLCRG